MSVLAAQADFEAASTYSSGSDEFVKRHTEAAKKLAELHEKYSNRVVGFYARLYEGRCYQAVGDYQRALGTYEEIISLSNVHPAISQVDHVRLWVPGTVPSCTGEGRRRDREPDLAG